MRSSFHKLRRREAEAVLVFDALGARWASVRGGGTFVGEAPVVGDGPAALAAAAIAARAASGDRSRACVLALSPALAAQRFLSLPRLPRKDMLGVLRRKGAALFGDASMDTLVCARRAGDLAVDAAKHEERWIVTATQHGTLRELLLALRGAGVHVARVVSMQLSAPSHLIERGGDIAALIVVALERSHTIVSLISDGEILNQNVLEGGFDTTPTMALTLLQEIKGFDAVHRKHRRGEPVKRIVVLGAHGERALLLRSAIQTALPQASCELGAATGFPDSAPPSQRRALLELATAALGRSPLQASFSVHLPARTAWIAGGAAASLTIFGSIGAFVWSSASTDVRSVSSEAHALAAQTLDLEHLLVENQEARARLDDLDALRARNEAIVSSGWNVDAVLEAAFSACGSEAAILSLSLGRPADGSPVEIEALTDPRPVEALRRVARIEHALIASSLFADVEARPGSTPGIGNAPFQFVVRGRANLP